MSSFCSVHHPHDLAAMALPSPWAAIVPARQPPGVPPLRRRNCCLVDMVSLHGHAGNTSQCQTALSASASQGRHLSPGASVEGATASLGCDSADLLEEKGDVLSRAPVPQVTDPVEVGGAVARS